MTTPKARRALATLLRDCRAEMLPRFTAQGLAATHNVTPAVAAEMLAAARRERL
jgi:hypothetical protein